MYASSITERLSKIPPDSLSLGKIDIGPVMDAKTLAKQNATHATINITKTVNNEEVTVDDCSRDDGYCGSEGPGESGRTRVLLRQHNDEGDGRSEERRETA